LRFTLAENNSSMAFCIALMSLGDALRAFNWSAVKPNFGVISSALVLERYDTSSLAIAIVLFISAVDLFEVSSNSLIIKSDDFCISANSSLFRPFKASLRFFSSSRRKAFLSEEESVLFSSIAFLSFSKSSLIFARLCSKFRYLSSNSLYNLSVSVL